MSRLSLAVVALLSLTGLAACDQYGELTSPAGQARMRLINVSPDTPPLSLAVNGAEVHTSVTFPGASEYAIIQGTRVTQLIVSETGGDAIGALSLAAAPGGDYATVVFGRGPQRALATLRSESAAAPTGQVRVRVVHTASELGEVDIYITPPDTDITPIEPTFASRIYTNVTAYAERLAGAHTVRITAVGDKTPLLEAGVQLGGGLNYTVFLIETAGPQPTLAAFLVQDSGL